MKLKIIISFFLLYSLNVFAACGSDRADGAGLPANPEPPVAPPLPIAPNQGAIVPYIRYDSYDAVLSGAVTRESSSDFAHTKTASQASYQEYVILNGSTASVSWTASAKANGVTVRFNLPDDAGKTGAGVKAILNVYVNGTQVKSVLLDSFWAYQYFNKVDPGTPNRGEPYPGYQPGGFAMMCFDEKHFLLDNPVNPGDRIELRCGSASYPLGIDFIELEWVDPALEKPAGALSVTDFGALPDDGVDDLAAIEACIAAAAPGQIVYFPPGEYTLSNRLFLNKQGTVLQGAGMWYTNLFFTNTVRQGGGIQGRASDLKVSHLYMNTINSTRQDPGAVNRGYHGFSGVWPGASVIEYVWLEHFTTGIWTGNINITNLTDGLRIANCRIRNTYADGINLANGTCNAIVEHCNLRNNGDDGLACYASSGSNARMSRNNTFRYCTVEFGWRAGGVGIFGGGGHRIHNLYIGEMMGSAGIRFTSTFAGYAFEPDNPIKVYDCTLYKCGTRTTLYNSVWGAMTFQEGTSVDKYDVVNMEITNVDIIDSQMDAIRMVNTGVKGIKFTNVRIDGTGIDGCSSSLDGISLKGYGIYTRANANAEGRGSATFTNVTIKNTASGEFRNYNDKFDLVFK